MESAEVEAMRGTEGKWIMLRLLPKWAIAVLSETPGTVKVAIGIGQSRPSLALLVLLRG